MVKKKAETPSETPAAEKITQKQAVVRALAAGKDQPNDGVAFIKSQFGMGLSNQAFSTLKSQIKKAAGTGKRRGRPRASANGSAAPVAARARPTADPVELARAVKSLVARYGSDVVADMAKVFAE
jgi:hypothetical protein